MLGRSGLLPTVKSQSKKFGADPQIIDAIIITESSYNPYAIRYESEFKYTSKSLAFAKLNHITNATEIIGEKISWGLGQIMGGTARELGFDGPLPLLCEPELNIELMIKLIQQLEGKYSKLTDVIASYNAGAPRKTISDSYRNQIYVDKVTRAMSAYLI